MYKQGAKSFIVKSDVQDLLKAIYVVYNGGGYITEHALNIIRTELAKKDISLNKKEQGKHYPKLTDFEKKLLIALCSGKSSTKMGILFFKSPRTIEKHREKLYKKFNVSCKEELIKELGHLV